MSRFVAKPNLPDGKVEKLVCGDLPGEIITYLENRKVDIFKIKYVDGVDKAISKHADIAVLHLGGNKIITEKRQTELFSELKQIGFDVLFTSDIISGEYPQDVKLNFALVGACIIGNLKYADKTVQENILNLVKLNTKQGYAKCSCLVVTDKAIITDDFSIHRVAAENGIDSLLIMKGDVELCGHNYGFIGGASGKISENEVIFFGDITKHRDYEKIKNFLEKYNCSIIYFKNLPLTDYGGIIPILIE